jgi:hypothetical protein
MATEEDLLVRGFGPCNVAVQKLNIPHHDLFERGPFCRLVVTATVPDNPGLYAWVVDTNVMYVGESGWLREIVQGQQFSRAYNSYTYIPPSQVKRPHDPRVRVNGLLNKALDDGAVATWWWLETETKAAAEVLEKHLRDLWKPPWNRI